MVERPDWGDGEKAFAAPVPAGGDAEGQRILHEMQNYDAANPAWNDDPFGLRSPLPAKVDQQRDELGRFVEKADPALAGLSEDQVERAAFIAVQMGADDPGFTATFDELSPGLQAKVFSVMANSPHKRGLDLLDAIEAKLTLAENVEAQRWLRALPAEYRALVRGN
jgi:hypothetical protein